MTRREAALIVCIAGLTAAILLSTPIAARTTHVVTVPYAGITSDFYHFHWNYWWMQRAVTAGVSIYTTDAVFAPFTSSLIYHTLTPIGYPIWALIEPIAGTVTALLAIAWLMLTLTGVAVYALIRDLGGAILWALVGALIVETSAILIHGVYWTNLNLMGWWWLPLLLIVWRRMLADAGNRRLWGWSLALGATVWAMLLTDLQYPLLILPIIAPYGVWTWITARQRGRLMGGLIAAVVISIALLIPFGFVPELFSVDQTGFAATPADRAPSIAPACFVQRCESGLSYGAILLPWVGVALLVGLLRRRQNPRVWAWVGMAIVPLLLSAGAALTIGGTMLTLPYQALHDLLGGMFRYPERFSAPATIALVIAAALALTGLRLRRRTRLALVSVFVIAISADARLLRPLPITPLPPAYDHHRLMAADGIDYVVVDVPTAGASGEGIVGRSSDLVTQFYALAHDKRVVNGHLSRVNTFHYMYMNTGDPMMAWLGGRRFVEPDAVTAQLDERLRDWRIGYIVVHRDRIGRDTSTVTEILDFFNARRDRLCPVAVEGDAVFYRAAWHPDGCPAITPPQSAPSVFTLDLGAADDARYLGQGWHYAEDIFGTTLRWSGAADSAHLYLDLPPGVYRIRITAQAFITPRRLTLTHDETMIGEVVITPDALAEYRVGDLRVTDAGLALILTPDSAASARDLGIGDDDRPLAIAVERLIFERIE